MFSAAQIATALQKSKRTVLKALEQIAPAGTVTRGGNDAKAWAFAQLPKLLQDQLEAEAARRGYRSHESILAMPPTLWQPPLRWADLAIECQERAAALQRALEPLLAKINDLSASEADFTRQGVEHYRRIFGHAISGRYWRKLWTRTLARDGGAEDWQRTEIFLDDALTPHCRAKAANGQAEMEAHELGRLLKQFSNPQAPTQAEIEMLWTYAFEHLEALTSEGKPAKKAKRNILDFLHDHAPFLAENGNGLRKQFDRKLKRWQEGGKLPSAVKDQRAVKSGFFRAPEISQEDKDLLTGHAVLFHGGNLSAAFRKLRVSGELSEAVQAHYLHNPASKSHVPRAIRNAVKTDISILEDNHHGPRQATLNGAHLLRDWSGVAAGDWYQADDCTLPIYYYEPDGNGWFTLWRGQFLLMVDVRSTRILGYAMLSSRNYHSLAIRTLITRTCDEHGLPRRGFYFENGIWKNSKILVGDKAPVSLPEAEKGLRDLGLEFKHAKLPRAKIVERILGMMQDLMEGFPGYCGRDERHDRFERVQKAKLLVERRKINPAGHFLSAEKWLEALDSLCDQYNSAIQDGKLLAGRTPETGWQEFANHADPQVKFDASCRYLLAHHRRPVKVTKNGITLHFGKGVFNYRNEQTGHLIGQTILAWFNPEAPETLAVTDINRQNPFTIERTQEVPAMDATREMMQPEIDRIDQHQHHAKAYYRTLYSKYARPFRRNLLSTETSALGEAFHRQGEAAKVQTQKTDALGRRARKVSAELRYTIPARDTGNEEKIAAAERVSALLNEKDET